MTPSSQMWFVTINTLTDAKNFNNWLSGRRVECNDSMEFSEWLAARTAFPLEFYLDGVVFKLDSRKEAGIFLAAWNAGLNLNLNREC